MSLYPADATAHLEIHLAAADAPQVRRHCPRCKLPRTFISSGKFRVNAQRKLLDVWLIYRCTSCDFTWNQTIHERTLVRDINPDELQALIRNDPVLAERHAGDIARLRAAGVEILVPATQHVTCRVLRPAHPGAQAILITIGNSAGCALRLDRILAWGLSLRRSEVAELGASAALRIHPQSIGGTKKALKRPAADGQVIEIALSLCPPEIRATCLRSLGGVREGVI